ncbi:hypothetical protein EGW08_005122 [Elysia chlorotica]|uniref:Uncharacterized protein n=1 Tax=Elysia chlorotica TaxID=188477 RepID=A0A433TZY4_ELYCH|nr:hypothetical protein EGW08_005122 [Elysia chlorotica]
MSLSLRSVSLSRLVSQVEDVVALPRGDILLDRGWDEWLGDPSVLDHHFFFLFATGLTPASDLASEDSFSLSGTPGLSKLGSFPASCCMCGLATRFCFILGGGFSGMKVETTATSSFTGIFSGLVSIWNSLSECLAVSPSLHFSPEVFIGVGGTLMPVSGAFFSSSFSYPPLSDSVGKSLSGLGTSLTRTRPVHQGI